MSLLNSSSSLSSNRSLSNSSNSSSCRNWRATWEEENDEVIRSCKIHLMRRILGPGAFHWAIMFDWGDYLATYEASAEDGYLIPRWKRGGPKSESDDGVTYEWYELREYTAHDCSPKQVNDHAKSIGINGKKYEVLSVNCHEWAKKLVREFGVILPPGAAAVARTGSTIAMFSAFLAGAPAAIAATAVFTAANAVLNSVSSSTSRSLSRSDVQQRSLTEVPNAVQHRQIQGSEAEEHSMKIHSPD
ncbi:unnamed protein product [Meganyctiphanes norvegica]|uniref:LRAT domain-containing protein n=1 Tax=Meganyctiphanes norvegica TaxID=48144 RepID=A0AAV2S6H5_MEGNR